MRKRQDVKPGEGQDARQRAAGDPLQLLPQHSAGRAPVAAQENRRRQQEIERPR